MKNRKAVWQAKRLQIKSMLFGGIIYIYKEQIVILDEAEKGIKWSKVDHSSQEQTWKQENRQKRFNDYCTRKKKNVLLLLCM